MTYFLPIFLKFTLDGRQTKTTGNDGTDLLVGMDGRHLGIDSCWTLIHSLDSGLANWNH